MKRSRHKYRAKAEIVDGIRFPSKKQANRYRELKLMEKAGEILELQLEPSWSFVLNSVKICTYRADFKYFKAPWGETVIEDVKGYKTPIYRLKKKMMKAFYGIDILET